LGEKEKRNALCFNGRDSSTSQEIIAENEGSGLRFLSTESQKKIGERWGAGFKQKSASFKREGERAGERIRIMVGGVPKTESSKGFIGEGKRKEPKD